MMAWMTGEQSVARFVVIQWATGAALGCLFAGLLLTMDTGGLSSLVRESSDPVTPVALLVAGFASLIGSLYAGVAVMLLPDRR